MKISLRKLNAIIELKIKTLINNTSALSAPFLSILMTIVMRVLYTSIGDPDPERMDILLGMAFSLGLSFNIGMGAIMTTSLPLAEEKEKHTLRALMTSSVNAIEFFLGSLIPPFVITVLVNYAIIFVSGVNIENINLAMFSIVTIIATLTSCMLGLLIGIYAKSQVHANNIMTPFIFVLALVPMFAQFNDSIKNIANYLYTGIVENMIAAFIAGNNYQLGMQQLLVLMLTLGLVTTLFVHYYKQNGFEKD